jgi:transcriptional regulator with XRE-family HTH domain
MAKPIDTELGARVAALREQRGWSQRALAKVLGMNQSVLSRIEAGKRRVSATELEEIAAALDVDLQALFSGGEDPLASRRPRTRSVSGFASSKVAGEAFAQAPPKARLGPPASRSAMYPFASRPERSDLPASGPERSDLPASRPPSQRGPAASPDAPRHSAAFTPPEGDRVAALSDDGAPATVLARTVGVDRLSGTSRPASGPPAPRPTVRPLPAPAHTVTEDYFRLRDLAEEYEEVWSSSIPSSDALGRRRPAGPAPWSVAGHVGVGQAPDRYARFLRHELGIGVDGPVPDLVTLFEDARVTEVVLARLAGETPVAANVITDDAAFVFVNAARPVTLQRFALVHAVAHVVLGHGDVVDERIVWSRAEPLESEANDFAEEFLAPVAAVARWYDRHGDPRPSVEVLLELAAAFGVTSWSALYRSRAAERLNPKLQSILSRELRAREWSLLPEQALRGGLRDTLSALGEEAPSPLPGARGVGGTPAPAHMTREPGPAAVVRVPARMRAWALRALRQGRLSVEEAARMLHLSPADLVEALQRAGLE